MEKTFIDEFGVEYDITGERLIKCQNGKLKHYAVRSGTKIIEKRAFDDTHLESVSFPDSVIEIGEGVFWEC